MSKKSELSELQGLLWRARKRFDNLTNVFYEQMESNQREKIVKAVNRELESDGEEDKDFEVPMDKPSLTRTKSRKGGDNKQYFAYRLNHYLGFAKWLADIWRVVPNMTIHHRVTRQP